MPRGGARWQGGPDDRLRTHPDRYRHWRLSVDGPVATLDDGGRSRRAASRRLRAEAQLVRPGVDIELHDAVAAAALRASRGARRRRHGGLDKVFCAGANIQMLASVDPRPQGQLLQVHERDPQRHRGRDAPTPARSGSPRSTAPPPAAATSWRSPATRSCSSTTAPRPCRCPRCRCSACCRAPAGSPAWSTSATCAATSPTCSPRRPKACGASRPSSGAWSTRSRRAARSTTSCASGPRRGPRDRPTGPRAAASSSRPAARSDEPSSTSRRAIDRDLRRGAHHVVQPERRPAAIADELGGRRSAWPLAACRELDDAVAPPPLQRARDRHVGARAPRATPSAVLAADDVLASTRDHWLVREVRALLGPDAQAPRPVGPHARRARRPRAAASPARSPSWCWPPTARSCSTADRRRPVRRVASPTPTTAGTRWPTASPGSRPASGAATTTSSAAARRVGKDLLAADARRRRPRDVHARRPRLGRRDPAAASRSAASFSPDALTGMEANLRFPGPETMETKIFARLIGLAELDLPAPQRRRPARRAAPLRHRHRARPTTERESEAR